MAISLGLLGVVGGISLGQTPVLPPLSSAPATLPPVQNIPQIPPLPSMPAGAPRPQLVPADAPPINPVMPQPSTAQPIRTQQPVPASTMTLTKPAGQETTRPVMAQPVSRNVTQPPTSQEPKKETTPTLSGTPAKVDPYLLPFSREQGLRFDGDDALNQRMMREIYESERAQPKNKDKAYPFDPAQYQIPEKKSIVREGVVYAAKTASYPPTKMLIEPGYVVHRKLLFEEKNAERYGWDLGFVQPFVSTAFFYKDTLLWPAHLASSWRERYDTSAGKCPPGSPVPYSLYPEEITLFGASVGSAVFVGSGFLFP